LRAEQDCERDQKSAGFLMLGKIKLQGKKGTGSLKELIKRQETCKFVMMRKRYIGGLQWIK